MPASFRRRQTCSHCFKTGHNRRMCPLLHPEKYADMFSSSQNNDVDLPAVNTIDSLPSVSVVMHDKDTPSSHVVNLRDDQSFSQWKHIPAYHTKKHDSSDHSFRVYDIAHAVREANRKQEKIDVPLSTISSQSESRSPRRSVFYYVRTCMQIVLSYVNALCSLSFIKHVSFQSLQPTSMIRFAVYVGLFLCLAILPFPALSMYRQVQHTGHTIIEQSAHAFLSLQSSTVAAFHANLPQAQYDLTQALASFDSASSLLEKEHSLLISTAKMLPIIGDQVKSRQAVLEAGHAVALGNTYLVKGIEEASLVKEGSLIDRFRIIRAHIDRSLPQYESALASLASVDVAALPFEYQEQFIAFYDIFGTVVQDMYDVVELVDAIELVFGGKHPRTHLVMFQNNREWRPTGGFTGSFAVVDFLNGKWQVEVPPGGTYDIQGQLDRFVVPPAPLQLVNKRWEFQDANWFPDFSLSAKKTAWFYERARGETVDGVIAVDATVLERLLRVLGPTFVLDSETALASLEDMIAHADDDTKPKQVIADTFHHLVEELTHLDTIDALSVLQQLHEALEQGEIKVYFSDESQSYFREFGWTGELTHTAKTQDYVHVSVANIGGAKTDAYVDQRIEHQSAIQEDGSIINTVIVHRHQKKPLVYNELYSVSNISYVRVYVPLGSELLDAGGFTYPPDTLFQAPESWYDVDPDVALIDETQQIDPKTGTHITREFDKTAFGNWMITNPGEEQSFYVVYRLPFSVQDTMISSSDDVSRADSFFSSLFSDDIQSSRYSLVVQKQSGKHVPFSSQVLYPEGWTSVWKSRPDIMLASNGASFETPLTTDDVYGVVFTHPVH